LTLLLLQQTVSFLFLVMLRIPFNQSAVVTGRLLVSSVMVEPWLLRTRMYKMLTVLRSLTVLHLLLELLPKHTTLRFGTVARVAQRVVARAVHLSTSLARRMFTPLVDLIRVVFRELALAAEQADRQTTALGQVAVTLTVDTPAEQTV